MVVAVPIIVQPGFLVVVLAGEPRVEDEPGPVAVDVFVRGGAAVAFALPAPQHLAGEAADLVGRAQLIDLDGMERARVVGNEAGQRRAVPDIGRLRLVAGGGLGEQAAVRQVVVISRSGAVGGGRRRYLAYSPMVLVVGVGGEQRLVGLAHFDEVAEVVVVHLPVADQVAGRVVRRRDAVERRQAIAVRGEGGDGRRRGAVGGAVAVGVVGVLPGAGRAGFAVEPVEGVVGVAARSRRCAALCELTVGVGEVETGAGSEPAGGVVGLRDRDLPGAEREYLAACVMDDLLGQDERGAAARRVEAGDGAAGIERVARADESVRRLWIQFEPGPLSPRYCLRKSVATAESPGLLFL